ncbi:hypothetical protein AVEN_10934-1 [Araneus ventricosus]|uniref:Uncharacterized protein n=1 Tax=Araneus ventricosus TaxID=182803 RepID=A0A4Y2W3H9_ARAVE|nr:hypothetical protein AVEN_273962-1 [Araneus ventricosus]GBO31036.1 hypothetical protein AVEN_70515-1 [Araneus ventricosus]GBO31040.1 hypothetical protein AVEN_219664-1 [Araneus ventricosus]GBO31074.1 hypothetical protein AVEN_10934-1 [Araneus ventricosus]
MLNFITPYNFEDNKTLELLRLLMNRHDLLERTIGVNPSHSYQDRMAWKFEERDVISSSDQGSKLRGPSNNIPRVASKRNVNTIETDYCL